jgi:Skp family chaperone for outer membrane proteins
MSWWAACLLAALPTFGQEGSEERPRTAVVNIQELFRNYYKSQKTQDEINLERARIQKDHNDAVGRLRSMDEGLRQLEARLQQLGARLMEVRLSDADRQALAREREPLLREKGLRLQERESLDRQRLDEMAARHEELNKKMVVRMESLLAEIRGIVAERAEKAGFDLVFDVEGLNTSQVPFLLHAKDSTDIKAMIQKELNKDAAPQN